MGILLIIICLIVLIYDDCYGFNGTARKEIPEGNMDNTELIQKDGWEVRMGRMSREEYDNNFYNGKYRLPEDSDNFRVKYRRERREREEKERMEREREAKEQIKMFSKDFDGALGDFWVIRLVGLDKKTYHKLKEELFEERRMTKEKQ